jgi:hypothetical protein
MRVIVLVLALLSFVQAIMAMKPASHLPERPAEKTPAQLNTDEEIDGDPFDWIADSIRVVPKMPTSAPADPATEDDTAERKKDTSNTPASANGNIKLRFELKKSSNVRDILKKNCCYVRVKSASSDIVFGQTEMFLWKHQFLF